MRCCRVGETVTIDLRNFRGSGFANDDTPVREVAGERPVRWEALGRGVAWGDNMGDDVRRIVTGVCVDNFEAGIPGVLKGEPDLELAEAGLTTEDIGDRDLGEDLLVSAVYF
jgi:hypothetical protein